MYEIKYPILHLCEYDNAKCYLITFFLPKTENDIHFYNHQKLAQDNCKTLKM